MATPANPVAAQSVSTVTTYPDGTTLTSSALTSQAMSAIIQQLTAQMLGINPITDALAYKKIRLDWPTAGQPGFGIGEDVAFVRVIEDDDAYNRIRDEYPPAPAAGGAISVVSTYPRVWRVTWTLYGPNSFDRARLLRTGLFNQTFSDALAQSHLYLVTDITAPQRNPEQINSQWWERSDFSVQLNEGVTEVITATTMLGILVVLGLQGTSDGGFGVGQFGTGGFGSTVITIGTTSETINIQE